ncbi:Beta-galactosidase-1-like protein 3 [Pteropus alecto]|uniref:Beta-galactosidase n=1 Tax=Pteropus alecto TaxID=9402 RepID=L5L2S6_PTEAL|nr:Beta-galactosidase-1-like protein 3 [Pteropus alecto]
MWAFLVRLVGFLCLSSGLLVMAQLEGGLSHRINQTHLTPTSMKNRHVGLKVEGSNFTLDGFPFLIIAGTIHYFRVPREYWKDRLLKLKACGFNTVTMHVPWSHHEPQRHKFYFTGDLDLRAFISIASNEGLWVILCPGPYIGSDLDLGGLPSWLLQDPKMKLRTTYKGFTKAVNQYFDQLIPRIAPFQYENYGPIIAVQVENEYGSYHLDKRYMSYVKKALVKRGIKAMLMTADDGQEIIRGYLNKVIATVHMKNIKKETYKNLFSIQGLSPILMMVYTTSSSDSWGHSHHTLDSHVLMKNVHEMFNLRFSFNFYMFHGGTNFGFIGGASSLNSYLPVVTSYGKYLYPTEVPMAQQPDYKPVAKYKSVITSYFIPLWDIMPYLEQPIMSARPICMEKLSVNQGSGQSYGYILYETVIFSGGILTSRGHVRDRGQVFLDQQYIGVLDRSTKQLTIPRENVSKDYLKLRILVENQGRLAYGQDINNERKGLTGDIYLNKSPLRRFKIYSLEMSTKFLQWDIPNMWKPVLLQFRGPAFFLGILKVGNYPKDTFVKLEIIVFEEFKAGTMIQFTEKSHLGFTLKKSKEHLISGEVKPQLTQNRFNWSHLTPFELKNRSVGLQAESRAESTPYFTLGGHKFRIFGGSIHYFRVPREYWRDRLLKLKACGFNTVTTYVPWNLHEPQRGAFDFSENLDLEAFVLMAAEIGLWVILRPGPYICSEIDLGGLPSWLLQDSNVRLRTTDQGFVEAVDKYFDHLIARVVPLQYRQGGPIIAVQVENEYGSFDKDKYYMPYIQQALLKRGIVELLLTSDAKTEVLKGYIKGVLAAINIEKFQNDAFEPLYNIQKNKPILVMEYWVGWFDKWGDEHNVKDAQDVENTVSEFIKFEISFNVYMFHGGTNFGFINGATNFGKHKSIATSYDYDAVLTEAGDYTEKYFKLRKLFGSVLALPLPHLPELTPKAVYPSMRPSFHLPLWDVLQYLNEPVISDKPINMENLPINSGNGQSYGFILYETVICSGGELHADVQDTAQVFLNDTSIGILDDADQYLNIPKVRDWNNGFVFINGRNLGRYWYIGPQETLYLPGTWLHPGDNEIILFEKRKSGSYIQTSIKPSFKIVL